MIDYNIYKLLINPIRHGKERTYLVHLNDLVYFKTGKMTGDLKILCC